MAFAPVFVNAAAGDFASVAPGQCHRCGAERSFQRGLISPSYDSLGAVRPRGQSSGRGRVRRCGSGVAVFNHRPQGYPTSADAYKPDGTLIKTLFSADAWRLNPTSSSGTGSMTTTGVRQQYTPNPNPTTRLTLKNTSEPPPRRRPHSSSLSNKTVAPPTSPRRRLRPSTSTPNSSQQQHQQTPHKVIHVQIPRSRHVQCNFKCTYDDDPCIAAKESSRFTVAGDRSGWRQLPHQAPHSLEIDDEFEFCRRPRPDFRGLGTLR